jgi:hypothetical protein
VAPLLPAREVLRKAATRQIAKDGRPIGLEASGLTVRPLVEFEAAARAGAWGPAAVACAIKDALKPLGVKIDTLPITLARLRALIREAEACQPAAAE